MLNEDRNQFQKEQNHFLKTMLDLRFFQPWIDGNRDEGALNRDANLEIYLTATCNQKCEYCYLVKHEGLYPRDCMSPEIILKNLRILFNWILEHGYHIPKCEYFTGEIWQTQFGLDVLELTLEYIKKGIQIDWWMIASNCSFLFDEVQTCRIQHYIDEFRNYGSQLVFSISVDGAVIENIDRPLRNGQTRDDKYYDRMFLFAKHNNFFFHPMVAAITVDKWIENHQWWEKHLKEWDMDVFNLMMLEVRNPDWTPEAIKSYNKFNKYLIDKYIAEKCDGDIIRFAKHLMFARAEDEEININGYIPWCFPETDSFIGCTCATDLTIRVGDLAICPCHRTAYNKYLYGKFIVENDKIVDIEANNPQMACKILMSNFNLASFGCDTCTFNQFCLKGCYGSQYEAEGDPFIPIPNVCNFFKEKNSFLLNYYDKLGVIDYYRTFTPYEKDYERVHKFVQLFDTWKKKEGKNYVESRDD